MPKDRTWTPEELKQILADSQADIGWDNPEEGQAKYTAPTPLLQEFVDWAGIEADSPLITAAIQSQMKYGGNAGSVDPATGDIVLAPEFAGKFTGGAWQDLEGKRHFTESPSKSIYEQMGGADTLKGLALVGTVAGGGAMLAPEVAAGGGSLAAGVPTATDLAAATAAGSTAGTATTAGLTGETAAGLAAGGGMAAGAGGSAINQAAKTGGDIGLGTLAGIGAAGSVGSALIGADAARKSGNIGADAAQKAIDAQLQMYFQSREDLAPWREAGGRAVGELEKNVMAGPGEFKPEEQPGYKFGWQELVERPLMQRASKSGMSGNILRELSDRAQGYASTSYDNWLNRWLATKVNPLQSLAGLGQTAATNTAIAGTQTGQGIGQSNLAGGQIQAGSAINQANAWTGGIKGATGNLLDYAIANKVWGGNLFGNAGGP